MTENEAIEVLSNELIVITDMIGYCKDFEKESDLALAYRVKRQEAHKIAISALKEVQKYQKIGTVEECREAVEKQKLKKPKIHKERFSNTYSCRKCGYVLIHRDETGWFCGQHYKFCPGCGQAIQWDENLEGMEE